MASPFQPHRLLQAARRAALWLCCFVSLPMSHAFAEDLASSTIASILPSIEHLVAHAPIIFSGHVLAVGPSVDTFPEPPLQDRPQVVTAMLRVDHGLRGVHDGDTFLYRRWQPPAGSDLAPGEQVVLFLHRPNAGGFTSPVFANSGRLAVTGMEQVDLRPLQWMTRQLTTHPEPPRFDHEAQPLPPELPRAPSSDACKPSFTGDPSTAQRFSPPCRSSPPMPVRVPPATIPEPQFLVLVRAAIAAQSLRE